MKAEIFYTLIAIACLDSTYIPRNGKITPHRNDMLRSKDGESNHQLSVTWGGLCAGSVLGTIICYSNHCCGGLPSLFNINFSYTYWFNRYVGIIGNLALFGDPYYSIICFGGISNSIVQLDWGIRLSYNGRGINRGNGRCYSGRLMVNIAWGSFMRIVNVGRFEPQLDRFGINISFVPIEMVTKRGFICGANVVCFDVAYWFIYTSSDPAVLSILKGIKIYFGKIWSL